LSRGLWCLLTIVLLGCHASGTWVDDDENWRRAFGQRLPNGVRLERSWYWRSPHFFREEGYFFAFVAPAEYEAGFRSENQMQPLRGDATEALQSASCSDPPQWFPQPGAPGFEAWASSGAVLLKNSASGRLYLAVCQL